MSTRSREYAAIGVQLDLGVLTAAEGYDLLVKHRGVDGPAEQDAARGLVADLDGHALALDVTGAALHAERGVVAVEVVSGAVVRACGPRIGVSHRVSTSCISRVLPGLLMAMVEIFVSQPRRRRR